jgi:acyl-CoA hydrolase
MNIEELPVTTISHLIKPQDLNHHGTLFAGRMAEWAVETGFIGAQKVLAVDPKYILCLRIYGMTFSRPVRSGDVIDIRARAAHIGTSSITIYIETFNGLLGGAPLLDAFITFVHVDGEGKSRPHGLPIQKPAAGGSLALWERAERLKQSPA